MIVSQCISKPSFPRVGYGVRFGIVREIDELDVVDPAVRGAARLRKDLAVVFPTFVTAPRVTEACHNLSDL